jgi:hypothetical protein
MSSSGRRSSRLLESEPRIVAQTRALNRSLPLQKRRLYLYNGCASFAKWCGNELAQEPAAASNSLNHSCRAEPMASGLSSWR